MTGLTAYTVSEYNDGKVTLSKIEHVPGGTGVILRGEAGSYELYANSESTAPYTPVSGNMLVGIIDDTLVSSSDNDFTNYILAHGNQGIGFYRIATEGTLTAQKAYLQLPKSTESRSINSISLQFCDNIVSGVSVISDSGLDDGPMYTLQGRRVTSPKKGIYILNGKKVIVK